MEALKEELEAVECVYSEELLVTEGNSESKVVLFRINGEPILRVEINSKSLTLLSFPLLFFPLSCVA